jgi:AcrR family transcriptional regulator
MTQQLEKAPISRMPATPPKTKKKETIRKRDKLSQKAIVSKATELFARAGFGSTSLDDIALAMGVTKGALYYHVKNKEEILRLIYLTVLSASEEPLQRIVEASVSPVKKLRLAVEHQTAIAADRSPALQVFYREQAHLTGPFAREITQRMHAYEHYFEQIIEEGRAAGVFRADIDSKIAVYGLLAMCNSLSQWYKPSGKYSPNQIAEHFVKMLGTGLEALPAVPEG